MGKAFTAAFPKRQTVALVGLATQTCGTIGDEGEAFDVAFLQGFVEQRFRVIRRSAQRLGWVFGAWHRNGLRPQMGFWNLDCEGAQTTERE